MQIYNYDAATGEFIGAGTALALPLREGLPDDDPTKWQVPANATTIAPPSVSTGQAAVFTNGVWQATPDHRGETWFSGYNQPVKIVGLGDPTTGGLTATEPPPPADALISYANFQQWAVATGGKTLTVAGQQIAFSTSETSMGLMGDKVVRLQLPNAPTTVQWQTGPTSFVEIAAADFIAAASQLADFVQSTFDALPTIFAGIAGGSITSLAEIDQRLASL